MTLLKHEASRFRKITIFITFIIKQENTSISSEEQINGVIDKIIYRTYAQLS